MFPIEWPHREVNLLWSETHALWTMMKSSNWRKNVRKTPLCIYIYIYIFTIFHGKKTEFSYQNPWFSPYINQRTTMTAEKKNTTKPGWTPSRLPTELLFQNLAVEIQDKPSSHGWFLTLFYPMYICIYVYMYICIYVCECLCICICICLCLWLFMYMYMYIYIYIYVQTYVYVYKMHMYVYAYMYMYMYMSMSIYMYMCMCMYVIILCCYVMFCYVMHACMWCCYMMLRVFFFKTFCHSGIASAACDRWAASATACRMQRCRCLLAIFDGNFHGELSIWCVFGKKQLNFTGTW